MNTASTKKKLSFLSMALGSLIVTSLSTGTAEASWSGARCSLQCTKSKVGKSDTKLNECATNCDNTKIMDILLPNATKLNADNQKHFQTALKYQQSTIEKQLKAEMGKKKPSQSKIRDLNAKQDKLIAEINRVESQTEELSKAPPRPKSEPHLSHPTQPLPEEKKAPERPKSGPHMIESDISKPPSDLPPEPPHAPSGPPKDMSPELPKATTKGTLSLQEELEAKRKSLRKSGSPFTQPSSHENESPHQEMLPSGVIEKRSSSTKPLTSTPSKRASIPPMEQHQKEQHETSDKSTNPLLAQIQAGRQLKKVQTKESPNIGAGRVVESDQPTTETKEQPSIKQPVTSNQPPSLLDQIKAGKQLKKVDQNAPKPKPKDESLAGVLKGALDGRRGAIQQKETISAKDKAALDNLLHNEKKTPQQIREMMDDDFDLFEDHNLVEEELKKLEK